MKWECWLVDRYVGIGEEKEQPGFAGTVASRTYGLIIASSGARCRRGHLVRASTPWQTLPIFFLFSPPHFLFLNLSLEIYAHVSVEKIRCN